MLQVREVPGVLCSGSVAGDNATRAVVDLLDDDIVCSQLSDLPGLDSDAAAVASFVSAYKGKCFLFQ